MTKNKIFDYEVSFLRAENANGYLEATSIEDATEKMLDSAKKQNLMGFKIRSLKEADIQIPDELEDESAPEDAVSTKAEPSRTLN